MEWVNEGVTVVSSTSFEEVTTGNTCDVGTLRGNACDMSEEGKRLTDMRGVGS